MVTAVNKRVLRALVIAWLVVWIAGPAPAQQVNADAAADFLLRALKFDRNLKSRSIDGIRILVLCRNDSDAKSAAGVYATAFQARSQGGIQGLPVTAQVAGFESISKLLTTIDGKRFNLIFAHDSLVNRSSAILEAAQELKIPTIAASRTLVQRGLAIGVFANNGSTKIIVNLPAAIGQGLNLSSDLLQLSEVLRADSGEIYRLLGRYETALANEDMAALKQVWPSLDSSQEKKIKESFRFTRSWQVQHTDVQVDFKGDLATVSCLRKDDIVTTDGQSVSNEAQITLALSNRSGAWLIDKIH